MDYEVFLLSRIPGGVAADQRRLDDHGRRAGDHGRIITAAAAIMFCVFGSFVIKDPLHILKVFGLGLARRTGRRDPGPHGPRAVHHGDPRAGNWWMPNFLQRSVPNIGVEVTSDKVPTPTAVPV